MKFDVSFLFGGQIKGERPRLFMIYSAGNFIECTTDTPYLQIGEHKYGKPVLDRAITYDIDLYDALKVGLVSVDSTMRSNLTRRHAARRPGGAARRLRRRSSTYRIEPGEPYFTGPAPALVGGAARRPPAIPRRPTASRPDRLFGCRIQAPSMLRKSKASQRSFRKNERAQSHKIADRHRRRHRHRRAPRRWP